jgi:hypothetical protein
VVVFYLVCLCLLPFVRAHVANAEAFHEAFQAGVDAYIKGSWDKAHALLTESNELMKGLQRVVVASALFRKPVDFAALYGKHQHPRRGSGNSDVGGPAKTPTAAPVDEKSTITGDGPSKTLLEYIEARDKQAPVDWLGFRPLTAK